MARRATRQQQDKGRRRGERELYLGGVAPSIGAVAPLTGMPIRCVEISGVVADVTLMTRLGCNLSKVAGYIDGEENERVEERYERYRKASDVAQVVASYLVCHPKVEEVRYPGLKSDESFPIAATTLVGGFGPIVDYRVAGAWRRIFLELGDAREAVMRLEEELREIP